MTRIKLVNMHKEISTAPDSFLSQQTLSGIMMVMVDVMEEEEEQKEEERNKKLFLTSPHPSSRWVTVSLGHHCP